MLIPAVYCITGSFFHYDGQKNDHKYGCQVIVAGYIADVIVAIVALVFGVSAFLAAANSLLGQLQIPLSVKVVSIVCGAVLLVGDTVFLYYRVVLGAEDEENQERMRLRQAYLDKLEERSAAVTEDIQKLYINIENLEKELIPEAQQILEDKDLTNKTEIIDALKSYYDDLAYCKAALENRLEHQEKLESLTLG